MSLDRPRRSGLGRLRSYLVTGLIVIAPIGVTAYILHWLFVRLDAILGNWLPPLVGRKVPGLGIAVLVIFILLVGWLSQLAAGKRLLAAWDGLLARVPIARRIYSSSSQIVEAVLRREEKLFQGCGLIEYPMAGCWTVVFITARPSDEIGAVVDGPALTVFLPTVPNPATGYLLVLPEERVHRLSMSVEDGFKLIVSLGVAIPER